MKPYLEKKIIVTEYRKDENIFHGNGKIYTFLNPVSYLDAIKNKQLFKQFDGIFADGSLLVAAIKLVYGQKVTRRSFDMTSVAPLLFDYAQRNHKSIYVVASKQGQVENTIRLFRERYPSIDFVGYRNGYFYNEDEQEAEARHIVEVAPDFLIVGMGTIAQEKFMLKVKDAGFNGIGFTCGGFIHQASEEGIDYYPAWVDKYNVRFLYRMYREPHTRKRYMKAGIIFPICIVWERFVGFSYNLRGIVNEE